MKVLKSSIAKGKSIDIKIPVTKAYLLVIYHLDKGVHGKKPSFTSSLRNKLKTETQNCIGFW
jgi:hypothetical protein